MSFWPRWKDPEESVRRCGASRLAPEFFGSNKQERLSNVDLNRAVKALIPLLKDPSESVRRGTTHVLGRLQDSNAIVALTETLHKDAGAWTRIAAAEALGRIGSPRATNALVEALRDPGEHVAW